MTDTPLQPDTASASNMRWHLTASLAVVATITLWRLFCLWQTPLDLFMDEAQYWLWGQELAFGYYSKPPLIGWAIRATTELGGNTAFWARLVSPLGHALAAVLIGFAARAYWRHPKAIWAGAAYATLPGVAVLSLFVSTDDLLLPAYAAALLAWVKLRETPQSTGWAIAMGMAIGLGMLAKYAMIYLVLALIVAVIATSQRALRRSVLIALAVAAAIMSPNLVWNAQQGFVTLGHTAGNAGWHGIEWNWAGVAEFLATQFFAFGPVFAIAFVPAVRQALQNRKWLLALLPLGILAAVTLQALIRAANGNWAAPVFIAATILTVPWALARWPRATIANLALNAALAVALPAATLVPAMVAVAGRPVFARITAPSELGTQLIALARQSGATAIISDDRMMLASLTWRLHDSGIGVYALPPKGAPDNQYEMSRPAPDMSGPTLLLLPDLPKGCANSATELTLTQPPETLNNLKARKAWLVGHACWR